jgi:hypothetical protein
MYIIATETRDRLDKKETVMKKRLPLLLVLAFVLTAFAPLALADHCFKCNLSGTRCVPATTGGKPSCDDSTGRCILPPVANCTGPHPREADPLAAEFTVVAVELLEKEEAPAAEIAQTAQTR